MIILDQVRDLHAVILKEVPNFHDVILNEVKELQPIIKNGNDIHVYTNCHFDRTVSLFCHFDRAK